MRMTASGDDGSSLSSATKPIIAPKFSKRVYLRLYHVQWASVSPCNIDAASAFNFNRFWLMFSSNAPVGKKSRTGCQGHGRIEGGGEFDGKGTVF